ncbi:hypothetical protein [Flexivirga sp. B27]
MSKRVRAAAVGIGAVLALAGCGSGGSAGPASQAGGGSATPAAASSTADSAGAVSVAQAQKILRAYDTANNAAIKAAKSPAYDEKAWRSADAGPTLAGDVFSTRLAKHSHDKSDSKPFTHTVTRAYGSTTRSSDGQAPWLLVTGIIPSVGDDGKPQDFASVFVKEPAGWRMWASLGGDLTSLPEPPSTVQSLTAPQRQAAANGIAALGRAVGTGSVDGIGKGSVITDYRTALHKGLRDTIMTVSSRPWGTPVDTDLSTATVVGTPAAHLLRVGGKTLGLVSFENTITYETDDGSASIVLDADHAAVEGGDTKPKKLAKRRTYQTMLVTIADDGKPTIVGSNDGLLAKA